MLRRISFGPLFALFAGFMLMSEVDAQENDRWLGVEQALSKDQPKTAIRLLEPIAKSAREEEQIAVAVKAELWIQTLRSREQDDSLLAVVQWLRERTRELSKRQPAATTAEIAITHGLAAESLWRYYQTHRYRIDDRTANRADDDGESADDPDLTTWSVDQFLDAIDDHFQTSLRSPDALVDQPTPQWQPLIDLGSHQARYTPTLFDFLSRQALRFYESGDRAPIVAHDSIRLEPEATAFAPANRFVSADLKFTPADPDHPDVRAWGVMADWLRVRLEDSENIDALLSADLERLRYASQKVVGETSDSDYREALERLVKTHRDHPASALVSATLAQWHRDHEERRVAHRTASSAVARHPDGDGAAQCRAIIGELEHKELSFTASRVIDREGLSIDIRFRNLDRVHFRLIRRNFSSKQLANDGSIEDEYGRPATVPDPAVVDRWSVDLPPHDDYAPHTERHHAERNVPLGAYWLQCSAREDFRPGDNSRLSMAIWRSELAILVRRPVDDPNLEVLVTDNVSGKPRSDVTVTAIPVRGNRVEPPKSLNNLRSGGREVPGWFTTHFGRESAVRCMVESAGGDRLVTPFPIRTRNRRDPHPVVERSLILTDRAIYRPGQTVHFKAIAHRYRHAEDDRYEVMAGERFRVVIHDANRQPVGETAVRTNAFGSAWGTFTLPSNVLTGQFRLAVEGGPAGSTNISVEAYKRPKFRVELSDPDAGRLGDPVKVSGSAKSYTGLPISGAKVRYTVNRQPVYPPWCWWRRPGGDVQVVQAETTTAEDGSFPINFRATAPADADPKSGVTYTFNISADVTDSTGETRSETRRVRFGFSELEASIQTNRTHLTGHPMSVRVNVQTLSGVGRPARGTLVVSIIRQPDTPITDPPPQDPSPRDPPSPFADGGEAAESGPPGPDPQRWPADPTPLREIPFQTDAGGSVEMRLDLPAGLYRIEASVESDAPVRALETVRVLDPDDKTFPIRVPSELVVDPNPIEVGQTATIVWGSGWPDARGFLEVEFRGQTIHQFWTPENRNQVRLDLPIREAMRGGVTIRATMVHDGKVFQQTRRLEVPWSNKRLEIQVQRWKDLIRPGQQEVIELRLVGPDARAAAGEVVATLYDASLDQYRPLNWPSLDVFRRESAYLPTQFSAIDQSARVEIDRFPRGPARLVILHPSYDANLLPQARGRQMMPMMMMRGGMVESAMAADFAMESAGIAVGGAGMGGDPFAADGSELGQNVFFEKSDGAGGQDEPEVQPRTNLAETTFFRPSVISQDDGAITIRFTAGEALTTWRFMALAHDQELRHGMVERQTVTRKDLMIQPNPPRFVREGDRVVWTAKLTNASDGPMQVIAAARFTGLDESEVLNDSMRLESAEQTLTLDAGGSETVRWATTIPNSVQAITHRFTVRSQGHSSGHADGEEDFVPVLPRRTLVRESMAINLTGGPQTATLDALLGSAESETIQHERLELEVVPDPQWLVLGSLPYLMEFPHECAEQTFNRLYANLLGRHVVASDPKIARVIRRWQREKGERSRLSIGPERREALLQETPWLLDSIEQNASLAKLAVYLEPNAVEANIASASKKLRELQNDDGSLSWFPGGSPNLYMTMYVAAGYGRLRDFGGQQDLGGLPGHPDGGQVDLQLPMAAWRYVDERMHRRMMKIKPDDRQDDHFGPMVAMYLDGRSRFLDIAPIDERHAASWRYWIEQTEAHVLPESSWLTRCQAALALHRIDRPGVVQTVMTSLRENAIRDSNGTYWKTASSPYWYDSEVETMAAIADVFQTIAGDRSTAQDIHAWLIRHRRTHHWPTTRSTAEAVATVWDPRSKLPEIGGRLSIAVGDRAVETPRSEAGTGTFSQIWRRKEIEPAMGKVSIVAPEQPTAAWASVHWSYFEDLSKVSVADGSDLRIRKEQFVKRSTDEGPRLIGVGDGVEVGDRLVTRLTMHVSRSMEFVHLRDHRPAGTEPVDVLSGYRWQDGVGFYQATGDTETNFFFDAIPKGTFVIEYETFATLEGDYQSGYANVQCMYAPEFAAHSESLPLSIKPTAIDPR